MPFGHPQAIIKPGYYHTVSLWVWAFSDGRKLACDLASYRKTLRQHCGEVEILIWVKGDQKLFVSI